MTTEFTVCHNFQEKGDPLIIGVETPKLSQAVSYLLYFLRTSGYTDTQHYLKDWVYLGRQIVEIERDHA